MFNFPAIILVISSTLSSVCTYHQVARVRKAKDKHTVSYIHVGGMLANLLTHFIYAFAIDELTLKVTIGTSFTSCLVLFSVMCYYAYFKSPDDLTRYLDLEERVLA